MAAPPKGLDETQLGAIVSREIAQARMHDRAERDKPRSQALEYFSGVMSDTPADEGRSSVVSRDVADVIGWLMPQLMRVFTASGQMAEASPCPDDYDPANPNSLDEAIARAKQATYGLNHVFWKDNHGYSIVYSATWDALLVGNGIIKTYWDDTPEYETSFHSGLNDDQLALLLMPDENGDRPEVLAQTDTEEAQVDPMSGQAISVSLHDVKIKRKKSDGRFVVDCIPPEEFLIDADAINTADAAFKAHWQQIERGRLVEMGFDPDRVKKLPIATRTETPEEQARYQEIGANESPDRSTELVDFFECYIRVDIDGDDVPELVKAYYGGGSEGELLDWEVWEDDDPFDDIPCEPMPHRWDARSVFDEVKDVQRVKTVMTRQAFDNIYATNNPQRFVAGKVHNPQALVAPSFGATVFGDINTTVTALAVPFVANHAFDALNYEDQVIQRRTGVSRVTMALDPEALQNQSATANQNEHDAAYSQTEILARNMAEWGWKRVFRKLLRLMRKHQTSPRTIMFKGKPIVIDPRSWNADMDVDINVGLGTGSRERDMMMLLQILGQQTSLADRYIALGAMEMAIDMLPKIVDTMLKFAEAGGMKNPEQFYPPITVDVLQKLTQMAQQRAAQPSPEMAKAQADAQLQQQKQQADAANTQAKIQADGQLGQQKLLQAQQQADREFELKQQQLAAELQLKREQLAAEIELKRQQTVAELELQRELGHARVQASAQVSSDVHPGGQPG